MKYIFSSKLTNILYLPVSTEELAGNYKSVESTLNISLYRFPLCNTKLKRLNIISNAPFVFIYLQSITSHIYVTRQRLSYLENLLLIV